MEVLDANNICFKLRSRKSGWETAIIQKGYELTGLALDRVIEQLKPGITEFEIAAEIEGLLRSRGSEGNVAGTIVAFGRKNTHPIVNRPGTNTLNKEDFGLLTFGPKIQGYNPSIGRFLDR